MAVVTLLLFSFLLQAVAASAGPPAARPPDFEALQKSFNHDEKAMEAMRRVVITKGTTEEGNQATTEGSDFADENFSAETKESEGNPEKKITEATTIEITTEEAATEAITTEATTGKTTIKPTTLRRLEILKLVRSTTPLPPPEDRLSPIEELRLLKKLSSKGIAFGVRNKELELIHNSEGELELPAFAFSEDENSVTEEDSFVTEEVSVPAAPSTTTKTAESTTRKPTSKPSTTSKTTRKSTTSASTTSASTTPRPTTSPAPRPSTTATPTPADIEVLEKELSRFQEEPFKVGTNIVPLHLFFEQSMGVHKRRKLAMAKKLSGEVTATIKPASEATRVPAMMQPFANTVPPRTDDFLIPQAEDKAHDEKMLDSFKFPVPSNESSTSRPMTKSKMPEKTILPSLLEMPHLSSLSSFGSLAVPLQPTGFSQRIRHVRLDSDALSRVSSKSKVSGKMQKRKRRRLLKKKSVHAAPNKFLDGLTVPLAIKIKKITPKEEETKVEKEAVKGTAKIVRTENVKAEEERFAKSLSGKESTTALIVDSLKKMKKVTRLLLKKKNRTERARANSGGKTVQVVPNLPHDGEAKAVKVDGNTDDRQAVVDRDFARKTVDRDV